MLRLFYPGPLQAKSEITLTDSLFHHACVVMRLREGETLRLFNDKDGAFEINLVSVKKKEASAQVFKKISKPTPTKPVHLAFSPLRPERMFFLIEKAVEMGVTDFHPLLMQHTQYPKCPFEKWQDQAIQAVQQSERFTVPIFHATQKLSEFLMSHQNDMIFAALERASQSQKPMDAFKQHHGKSSMLLIGPEGGFATAEKTMLEFTSHVILISLGEYILRAETAALMMLSLYQGIHL